MVQWYVEGAGCGSQEPSRAGGAFIVHAEIDDLTSFGNPDGLRILASHIHYGSRSWEHVHGATTVAADLGDLHVAKRHSVTTVPGPDYVLNFLFPKLAVPECLLERMLCSHHDVGARIGQPPADNLSRLIDDDRLGLCGADVHARCVGHGYLPSPKLTVTLFPTVRRPCHRCRLLKIPSSHSAAIAA